MESTAAECEPVPPAGVAPAIGRRARPGVREETTGARAAAGQLAQLALTCVVATLTLHALGAASTGPTATTPPAAGPPPRVAAGQRAMPANVLPFGGTAPPRPPAAPAQPRIHFADLRDAGQRMGMSVWQPSALPPGLQETGTAWELAEPQAAPTPGTWPPGVLLTWYDDGTRRRVVTLGQGPGIGLVALGAPPDRRGAATLANGVQVVWVEGHGVFQTEPGGGLRFRWEGGELRVGIGPTPDGSSPGWWLESGVLSLAELLHIAEGLTLQPAGD
jgi:hypothetical protein